MVLAPTVVGLFAAFCTTVSYIPQLRKCWSTGKTDDLSLKMLSILALGILLWVIYGAMQRDVIIIFANSISLCLLAAILFFKLREGRANSERAERGTRRKIP
jgi:MtN3 and saliva related transmembrane protein